MIRQKQSRSSNGDEIILQHDNVKSRVAKVIQNAITDIFSFQSIPLVHPTFHLRIIIYSFISNVASIVEYFQKRKFSKLRRLCSSVFKMRNSFKMNYILCLINGGGVCTPNDNFYPMRMIWRKVIIFFILSWSTFNTSVYIFRNIVGCPDLGYTGNISYNHLIIVG